VRSTRRRHAPSRLPEISGLHGCGQELTPSLRSANVEIMSNIISFIGLRSGVGNSALVRTFAVEAAEALDCVVVDFDSSSSSTYSWAIRRNERRLKPSILVEPRATFDLSAERSGFDLVMVDASNCSEQSALELARISRVVVMTSTTEPADVARVIDRKETLSDVGLSKRIFVALCQVRFVRDATAAREVLTANGVKVLSGAIGVDLVSYPRLEREGRALCESSSQSLAKGAAVVVDAIQKAFVDGTEDGLR
jgi:MinD-like ATPase involved in chromosome partitioning or flagellar assembly